MGDLRFRREFKQAGIRGVRIVNDRDMVPHIPGACETFPSCFFCLAPCACCPRTHLFSCDHSTTPGWLQQLKCLCAYACCMSCADGVYYHVAKNVVRSAGQLSITAVCVLVIIAIVFVLVY